MFLKFFLLIATKFMVYNCVLRMILKLFKVEKLQNYKFPKNKCQNPVLKNLFHENHH